MTTTNLAGRDAVLAALTGTDLIVPPAEPSIDAAPNLAWLRASVGRFSSGVEHERRRGLFEAALARAEPQALRDKARRSTSELLAAAGAEIDLMAAVANVVPVRVLAQALAIADPDGTLAGDVGLAARSYVNGPDGPTPDEDAAVARLVAAVHGSTDEPTAAIIGVLVQSFGATAGLIGNAALTLLRTNTASSDESDEVVARTLREDPPTLATRRMAVDDTEIGGVHIGAGDVVWVDLASAGLTLGAGPHACPGANQAIAITAGVVEALHQAGARLGEEPIEYAAARNVRVPLRLMLRLRQPGGGRSGP